MVGFAVSALLSPMLIGLAGGGAARFIILAVGALAGAALVFLLRFSDKNPGSHRARR
jgi:hypothetical protein